MARRQVWMIVAALAVLLQSAAALAVCPIPLPSASNWPSFIDCVGFVGGTLDPRGQFTVTLNDGTGPCAGVPVEIDLCACSDMQLGTWQFPGTLAFTGPTTRYVEGVTNAAGIATFRIHGSAENSIAGYPGPGRNCVGIWAGGIGSGTYLGSATATFADENGVTATPGVEPSDMNTLLWDWGLGVYHGRSDFNHDGIVSPMDIAFWLHVWGAGASSGGGPFSPSGCP
jgi:hypothetical protein